MRLGRAFAGAGADPDRPPAAARAEAAPSVGEPARSPPSLGWGWCCARGRGRRSDSAAAAADGGGRREHEGGLGRGVLRLEGRSLRDQAEDVHTSPSRWRRRAACWRR